jgi:hypothetical protein
MDESVQLLTCQGCFWLWQVRVVEALFGSLLRVLADPFLLELILTILIVADTIAVGWTKLMTRAPLPVVGFGRPIVEETDAGSVLRLCHCG